MPLVDKLNSKVDYLSFSFNVYFYGDQRAYNRSDTMVFSRQELGEDGEVSNRKDSGKIISDQWLFCSKNSLLAFHLDTLQSMKPKIVNADSAQKTFLNFTEESFGLNNYRLIRTDQLGSGLKKETYVVISKPNDSYSDTAYYYYSQEMNDIDFAFSRKIDRQAGMKLYKITLVYDNTEIKDTVNGRTGYVFDFLMERIVPPQGNQLIINRFEEFRKMK